MRTVTAEEARNAYANTVCWAAKNAMSKPRPATGRDHSWMFKPTRDFDDSIVMKGEGPGSQVEDPNPVVPSAPPCGTVEQGPLYTGALSPDSAIQRNWLTPCEFRCYPDVPATVDGLHFEPLLKDMTFLLRHSVGIVSEGSGRHAVPCGEEMGEAIRLFEPAADGDPADGERGLPQKITHGVETGFDDRLPDRFPLVLTEPQCKQGRRDANLERYVARRDGFGEVGLDERMCAVDEVRAG